MEKNVENKKIGSFTGLRFIMIMVIVVSHFEFLENLPSFGVFYQNYLHNATMAVDFFFLLSGFGMMLGNLSRIKAEELRFPSAKDCLKYGIRHVKKIYPVYIVTIAFGLCAQITFAVYKSKIGLSFILKQLLKLFVNIPILQSATGMSVFTHAYNGVTWFLSALFCIYLISPILIYLLRKSSKSFYSDFLYIIINFILIIVLAFVFEKVELYLKNQNLPVDNLVYGSPYRRVFYVLIGMNLAMIFQRITEKSFEISNIKANFFEILICSISILYFFTRNILPAGKYKYFVDVCLCAFLVFIFAFDKGCIPKILKKPFFQHFGNIAMYIFLIHYPIRIYCGWFVEKLLGWTFISSLFFIIFILFSTFILSDIIYRREYKKA